MMASVEPAAKSRVMVRMRGTMPSRSVFEAAIRVARTFRAELHGQFIEDERLLALAAMPFARETAATSAHTRELSPDTLRREMLTAAVAMRQEFSRVAERTRMKAHFEVHRGERASFERAPGEQQILAVGEPLAPVHNDELADLVDDPSGLDGILIAGPAARRVDGPILAVVGSLADIPTTIHAAVRVARGADENLDILIVHQREAEAGELERGCDAQVAGLPTTRVFHQKNLSPAWLARLVDQSRNGLVIGSLGGPLGSDAASVSRSARAITCPVLLMT